VLAFRHRDFRLLWTGQLLSALGDWFVVLAIPVHVYQETGSPAATGLMYAATTVPAAVVGPFAGVLVDRRDRRLTMATANAARAILLVAMAFGPIWVLIAGVVAERIIGQLHEPASAALVPNVVGAGAGLVSANAALSASSGVVRLVGAPSAASCLQPSACVPCSCSMRQASPSLWPRCWRCAGARRQAVQGRGGVCVATSGKASPTFDGRRSCVG
jgi:MFS family permease